MKQLAISILLVLAVFTASAQQAHQIGIYTEGAWFMPKEFSSNSNSLKNGFGVGAGIYVSSPIWKKLSAVAGLGYRYKENKVSSTLLMSPPIQLIGQNLIKVTWSFL